MTGCESVTGRESGCKESPRGEETYSWAALDDGVIPEEDVGGVGEDWCSNTLPEPS